MNDEPTSRILTKRAEDFLAQNPEYVGSVDGHDFYRRPGITWGAFVMIDPQGVRTQTCFKQIPKEGDLAKRAAKLAAKKDHPFQPGVEVIAAGRTYWVKVDGRVRFAGAQLRKAHVTRIYPSGAFEITGDSDRYHAVFRAGEWHGAHSNPYAITTVHFDTPALREKAACEGLSTEWRRAAEHMERIPAEALTPEILAELGDLLRKVDPDYTPGKV